MVIRAVFLLIAIHVIHGFSFTQMSFNDNNNQKTMDRRAALGTISASAFLLGNVPAARASYIDPSTDPPQVTKRVYLDVLIGGKDEGRLVIGLYGDLMPKTVENFGNLFESNAYAGTNFYRVISDFSIQGGAIGDPSGKTGQPADGKPPFEPDNYNLKHTKAGLISAVRGLDGRVDSRFYINVNDNGGWGDDRYAAFGIVERGMDIVAKIEKVPVKPPKNSPVKEVKILGSGSI